MRRYALAGVVSEDEDDAEEEKLRRDEVDNSRGIARNLLT